MAAQYRTVCHDFTLEYAATMNVLRRFLLGLLALSLVLLIALPTWAYFLLRGSIPLLRGEVPGAVTDRVLVERDAAGIPTLTAQSEADLWYGLGFLHGQERYFSMDLSRRLAAGELSEIFGVGTLDLDKQHRFFQLREKAEEVVENLPSRHRKALETYVAGVNAGLEAHSVKPFPYLMLRSTPGEWAAEDSILVGYSMYLDLQQPYRPVDYDRFVAAGMLKPSVYRFLFENGWAHARPMSRRPKPVLEPPTPADWPEIEGDSDFGGTNPPPVPFEDGSNAFAVAAERSKDGQAWLAVDMHLGLNIPNVWYRASLRVSDSWRGDGVTLPGLPGLIVGTGRKIAWGFTVAYIDTVDLVLAVPAPGQRDRIRTAEGYVPVTEEREEIRVRGGEPLSLSIRKTPFGPIREIDDYPFIYQWTGLDTDFLNLDILDLPKTGTVEEAIEIAHRAGLPTQNLVLADARGKVAWTLMGGIPERPGPAQHWPALSTDADVFWTGKRAKAVPTILNPGDSLIWTANDRVLGREKEALLGDGGYSEQGRATVIAEKLEAESLHSRDTLFGIQTSTDTAVFDRWVSWLRYRRESIDSPAVNQFIRLLEDFDGKAETDSRSYLTIRTFRAVLAKTVFGKLLQPLKEAHPSFDILSFRWDEPLYQLMTTQNGQDLDPNGKEWRTTIIATIEEAIAYLENRYDGLGGATWGNRNRLNLKHPLTYGAPYLSPWLNLPSVPVPGDVYSPRAQSPDSGASQRMVVSPGKPESGYFHMPPGQSGHFLSPYYRAGFKDWLEARPSPLLPGKAKYRLKIVPER